MPAGSTTLHHRYGGSSAGAGRRTRFEALRRLPRDQLLARLGYALKCPIFALPFYGLSLAADNPTQLEAMPSDPWPGDAEVGRALIAGCFVLAGQTVEDPRPLWTPRGSGRPWRRALHSFGWLRDLRAAGGDAARRRARELTAAWLARYAASWHPLAWHPTVTSQRLGNWLGHYEFFAASAAIELRHRLLYEMTRQARHLNRSLPAGLEGARAVAALKGLVLAGAYLPGGGEWLARGLKLLRRELPRQVRADGGHVERSPQRQFEVLRDLIDLRGALHAIDRPVPGDLQAAIEQMAPVLRLLQHGDGALALFNASAAGRDLQVEMVLQRAGRRGRPLMSAPQSGFQRLQAGRTLVLVDAGVPPPAGLDRHAHAGTLSFEMSVGRERLIVNCGTHPGDAGWRRVLRATAAHSTAVVDDVNSAELARDAGLRRRPAVVVCRREEDDGNVWLDMSHDGYRGRLGVLHRRRFYLAAAGEDLRGEDSFEGGAGCRFALRFHLHPAVLASLTTSGDSVLLRLAKGGGWRLRAQGAGLALEESIYFGQAGEPRKTAQVVLAGRIRGAETTVKWALQRESKA